MKRSATLAGAVALLSPNVALAHASEKALVLLLPTKLYIASGVAAVALTVAILAILPARLALAPFHPFWLTKRSLKFLRPLTSLLSATLLLLLIWVGLTGPHDPLGNPLPLFVWTVLWIGIVTVQAIFGNIWAYLNPWTGPLAILRRILPSPLIRLPAALLHSIGLASFLGFATFMLADPAPSDPHRLAKIVALYWIVTLIMASIFGPQWLRRAEGLGLMLKTFSRIAVLGRQRGLHLGMPGWQILSRRPPTLAPAILSIFLLGTGSFDGLHETFRWLGLNGINPFEHPGRSALILHTTIGLLLADAALLILISLCIWIGLRLARSTLPLGQALRLFAPTILPIALGYHIAHYLPTFLVEGQYTLVVLSDPFNTGADYLNLGAHYVSTGFFNAQGSVRVIFLTQASAVVIGHVLAVMLAHAVALQTFGGKRAALSQASLALFMIGYTLFGLWLLAAPRL